MVPCDFDNDVIAAYGAVVTADVDEAQARLDDAEGHVACADDPAALGRFWLVEAAVLAARGDPDAELSLAAARRVAPDLLLPALSDSLHLRWSAARPEPGVGTLALDVPLGARTLSVDGARWTGGPVPAGLHALSVGEPGGEPLFGAIVYVGSGTSAAVATGLAPPPVAAPAPGPPAPPRRVGPLSLPLALGVGASLAVGRAEFAAADGLLFSEPAGKWVVPIELSQGIGYRAGWARVEVGVGWLFAGPYLGVRADGSLHHTSTRLDLAVAGGGRAEVGWVGGSAGVQWPGRLAGRALAGTRWGQLGWCEARLGLNVGTDARLEPAAELLVGGVVDWGGGR
jgi:hypothetical protein